jgi:hypothetical protein
MTLLEIILCGSVLINLILASWLHAFHNENQYLMRGMNILMSRIHELKDYIRKNGLV